MHMTPTNRATSPGTWIFNHWNREVVMSIALWYLFGISWTMIPRPGPRPRWHLTSLGNPIVEIRRSYDRLISTMGFPVLVRWHLYIESGPSSGIECLLHCKHRELPWCQLSRHWRHYGLSQRQLCDHWQHVGCRWDNLQCLWWRQNWHHDICQW